MNLKQIKVTHLFYLALGAFVVKILFNYTFLRDVFIDSLSSFAIMVMGLTPEAALFGINAHENLLVLLEITYSVAFVGGVYLHFKNKRKVTYVYAPEEKGE